MWNIFDKRILKVTLRCIYMYYLNHNYLLQNTTFMTSSKAIQNSTEQEHFENQDWNDKSACFEPVSNL